MIPPTVLAAVNVATNPDQRSSLAIHCRALLSWINMEAHHSFTSVLV
jgi:hypothetical protein